jgi:hypothetical protein
MNRKLGVFSVLLFALTGTAQAASQTITFDSTGSNFFHNHNQEHTNNWQTYNIDSSRSDYEYSGFKSMADALSVEWVALNSYLYSDAFFYTSSDLSAPFGGEFFNLDDFWLASGFGSQTLVIIGFDVNGDHIYSDEILINTQAKRYQFGWEGISAFVINTYAFDDFVRDPRVQDSDSKAWVLGSVTVTVVPEPETYAMLLAGLGIVGAVTRSRRTKAAM